MAAVLSAFAGLWIKVIILRQGILDFMNHICVGRKKICSLTGLV